MKLPSDPFLRGYLIAAFWTEEMMAKLSPEALAIAEKDCAAFRESNASDLALAWEMASDGETSEAEFDARCGHDFWLSRNGHGSGYFDRDYADLADTLQVAARTAGETDLYEGDDGLLYFSR